MPGRVRLPADIEVEDRLAFGLTARQLLLAAATATAAYAFYALASSLLPGPVALALTCPLALAGVLVALGRFEGLPADRLALSAARFLRAPRRQVLAPEGLPAALAIMPAEMRAGPKVAPLDLPIRAVLGSGLVELEGGRFCLLLRARGASFLLRGEEEQAALVEAFGRFLNSLTEPIQIAIRSQPVDLEPLIAALEQIAAETPRQAIARAAGDHARFLTQLTAGEGIRRREILLALPTTRRDRTTAGAVLDRRAQEAVELLRPAGIELAVLDGEQAAELLARALDPPGPPNGSSLEGAVRPC